MTDSATDRFGPLLRRHRLAAGLSQAELAERAGLSLDGIGALEAGRRASPRPYTVRALADALSLAEDDRITLIAAAQLLPLSDPDLAEMELQIAGGERGRLISPPRSPTRLIGREREVANIAFPLRSGQAQLMTLTGPGGVGKTRLAIAAAEAIGWVFPDGVAWVELAHLTGPAEDASSLVAGAIARALGTKDPAPLAMAASLATAIGSRKVLLVLDNFEHLLSAAPLISELLAACPDLAVLATSRERLHVRGEREFAVRPLAVPDRDVVAGEDATGLSGVAAVRLFAERAAEVRSDFALTPANTPAVTRLCRQLDGLPLAIELAVRWVKVLSPESLTERLVSSLPMLAGGAGDLPDRQRTMRDTIAWSYALLRPEEQALFRRLGVFAGGFTLEAAEYVGGKGEVLDGLASLVDKSLIHPVPTAGPEASRRFGMLETIREFALEQLAASGEIELLRAAHAAYFVTLAETFFPRPGIEQEGMLENLAPEVPNLRSALSYLVEGGQAEAALRLAEAWHLLCWSSRADSGEALRWLETALVLDGAPEARVHALIAASGIASLRGNHARGTALADEALAISTSRDYPFGVAYALFYRGVAQEWAGDLDGAAERYAEAIERWHVLDEPYWLALTQTNLGIVKLWLDDVTAASTLVEAGLAGSREVGDAWGTALALGALAAVTCAQGDLERAISLHAESLALWSSMGDQRGVAGTLAGLAGVSVASGNFVRATELLGAATALAESVQATHLVHHEQYERVRAAARAELDDATFAQAWAAGREMTPADVSTLLKELAPSLF